MPLRRHNLKSFMLMVQLGERFIVLSTLFLAFPLSVVAVFWTWRLKTRRRSEHTVKHLADLPKPAKVSLLIKAQTTALQKIWVASMEGQNCSWFMEPLSHSKWAIQIYVWMGCNRNPSVTAKFGTSIQDINWFTIFLACISDVCSTS